MKLFKSLSLIATLCASLSHAMDQSFEGAPNVTEIRWKKDNFDNILLNPQDIDLARTNQLFQCAQTLRNRNPEKAILIHLPHTEGHKIQHLVNVGFKPRHIDSNYTELVIKNGSPMPEASTATAGARVLICRNNEVLMIEDKGMKGYAVYPGGSVDARELALDAACREIKEEVGLRIQASDMQQIALVNRVKGNEYGYSDYCNYYMTRTCTGNVQIQESEVAQAFWAPLADIEKNDTINNLKVSAIVKILAAHIVKNGCSSSQRVLDPRQYACPGNQKDCHDVMDIGLFAMSPDNETNSNL